MKTILVILLFLGADFVHAQNSGGYFGRKFFASAELDLYTPLMFNLTSEHEDYPKYSKDFDKSSDVLNYGAKLSVGYIAKQNLIIGFEGGIEFSDTYLRKNNHLPGYGSFNFRIPKVALQTVSFFPQIEIGRKRSLFPLGFSHQIGIGLSQTKLVNRVYECQIEYDPNYFISLNPSYIKDHFYDFEGAKSIKFLSLMYGVNLRSAISKRILFSYGVRYTFKLQLVNKVDDTNAQDFIFSRGAVRDVIYRQQSRSILRFNFGLTYVF